MRLVAVSVAAGSLAVLAVRRAAWRSTGARSTTTWPRSRPAAAASTRVTFTGSSVTRCTSFTTG
jgi:hypothetical protein